ncbi:MAG: 50S ribosomal protein L29 [Legionella sp.]
MKEFIEMTLEDLHAKLFELRKEQFTLRLKKANGALDKTHLITKLRKDVARVKTVISQKAGSKNV